MENKLPYKQCRLSLNTSQLVMCYMGSPYLCAHMCTCRPTLLRPIEFQHLFPAKKLLKKILVKHAERSRTFHGNSRIELQTTHSLRLVMNQKLNLNDFFCNWMIYTNVQLKNLCIILKFLWHFNCQLT